MLWSKLSRHGKDIVYLCSCFVLTSILLPSFATAQYCAQPTENLQYENIVSHSVTNCGNVVTMQVNVNGTFNGDIHYVKIYFDKDQDGTTYEAEYDLGNVTLVVGAQSVFQLTVTNFTTFGAYNYRVVMAYNGAPTGSCNALPTASNWGDFEDSQFTYTSPLSASPNNATICIGDNTNVGNNASGGTSPYLYEWSVIGGTSTGASLTNTTNSTVNVNTVSATIGSIDLQLKVTDAIGCENIQTAIVNVSDKAVVSAGSDQQICENQSTIALAGSISGAVTTGIWSGGAGSFSPSVNVLNPTYTPTASEISSGLISLVLTSDDPPGPCGTVFDVMSITVETIPTADAGIDIIACGSGAISLNGSITGSTTTGIWSGGAGTFNPNTTALSATYSPTAAEIALGSITLTLTPNISSGACSTVVSDDIKITLTSAPIADAGAVTIDCITSLVTLNGTIGGSATTGTWSGGAGTFSPNATTLNATYTPTPSEVSSGSIVLTLTTDDPAGNCIAASDNITASLGINIAATPVTNTICAGNDLIVPGNPTGGTGNYVNHVWTIGGGTTATGVLLSNDNTTNVTVNADAQGAVYLSYTVTDDNGCTATGTTIINVLYSPLCQIDGPLTSCNGGDVTLNFVPQEFSISPPSGSVVSGSQGQLGTHVFSGVTSPDEVRVVITLPTWDDSFFETTLNGNVLFPASNEPQSWNAGGLNLTAPWAVNVNGLPRTIITITSTSVTYEVSQSSTSTTMTTVVPTNWTTTPQPFQVGTNTLVFGIKNTFGPTSGSWTLEAFQDLTQTYLWSTGSTIDSINVNPTTTTTYTVTVTNSTGCSRTCSHTVLVEDIAIAGDDKTICAGASVQIGQAPVVGVTYSWSPSGSLSASNVANPSASPISTTEYIVTATTSSGCADMDTVTVVVENPTSAVVDQSLCIGQVHTIDGQPQGGMGAYTNHLWTELSSTATGYILSDINQQVLSFNASNASPGFVVLRYTADATGCSSISKDITITLGPNVNFVGSGVVCENAGLQALLGTPSGGGFSGTGVSGGNFDPSIAGVGTHIITYTYTDGSGCIVSKSDAVTVQALPCSNQTCTILTSDGFEANWGAWNDGGADAARSNQFPNSGTRSIRLRDNSGSQSSMFSDPLDMTSYTEAVIDFSYYVRSFDNANEDFFLEISLNGGTTYTLVEEWNLNDEFVNNQRYNESVTVTGFTFTTTTVFRFRADASSNGDQVYIDDVVVQGCVDIPPVGCTLVSYVGGLTTSGNENDLGTLSINLEIAAPLATDLNITYYTVNGTASAGSDYIGVSTGTAIITAGNTSTSVSGTPIQVAINGDTDVEIDEDFEIVIASNSVVCANPDSVMTVTILNDENSAPILTNIENDNLLYCPASSVSTIVTQTITVDEPEGDNLSATVTLTGTTDPAADILSVNLSAYPTATATYSYPTLTISGTIPPADMQAILRSVEFFTNSVVMGVRSIEIVINDGTQNSNTGTRNINSDENDAACCNASAPSIGK